MLQLAKCVLLLGVLSFLNAFLCGSDARASSLHIDEDRWHEYARYVQSLTKITLDDAGNWRIETKFSNGNRTVPQSMMIYALAVTEDGACVFGAIHEVDLRPSFGGSASEYTSTSYGSIDKSIIPFVSRVEYGASQVTNQLIRQFNALRPYGQTMLEFGQPNCDANAAIASSLAPTGALYFLAR